MSLRHRLSHHSSRRPLPPTPPQQQQKQKQREPRQQRSLHSPRAFGTSFHYQQAVVDGLSVDLGHPVGYFDSVKGSMRQIYHLLIVALCRHDPLPRMVRGAIDSLVLTPPAPPPPPPPQPPPPPPPVSPHQPLVEQQHRSDIETITALDIPYTLRHFDFDLSVVNNSEGSAWAPTATVSALAVATAAAGTESGTGGAVAAGGTVSFSLSDLRTGHVGGVVQMRACRLVADLLVADRLSATIRRAVEEPSRTQSNRPEPSRGGTRRVAASGSVSGSGRGRSSTHVGINAAPNSALDTSPAATSAAAASRRSSLSSSSTLASSMSSMSPPPPSLLSSSSTGVGCRSGGVGYGGNTAATVSLTAPLMLTVGMDGSNSNRATSQLSFHQQQQQQQARSSAVSVAASAVAATADLLCPLHSERSRAPASEFSCVVCASQHFLHRHLQRLALDSGGLARLEDVLCDCLRLQEQWRRSVNWVAGSVKDKRLPESLRPLIRCICADACCEGVGGGGGGRCRRGVTVNPQIIIATDGHCSALQCVSRCGGGTGSGGAGGSSSGGGGGGGGGGNCCWDTQAPASRDAAP